MKIKQTEKGHLGRGFLPVFLLLLVASIGITALMFFWGRLFQPGELGALNLPLVAFVAGLAATFSPCALPALPAFLALVGSGDAAAPRGRLRLSFTASLGAVTLVLLLGLLIALLGEGTEPFVRDNFRWVQLGVGLFLIIIAVLHLSNQTSRLPPIGVVMDVGHRIWENVMRNPTPGGGYLLGGGYVLVGVG